jgi:hypothetical protein
MLTRRFKILLIVSTVVSAVIGGTAAAAAPEVDEALTPLQQRQSEQAVDRAIRWLASQQRADGAFAAPDYAQPGITGLGVLAMLSRGHLPGQGEYGENIERGIRFILSCSREDGMLSFGAPEPIRVVPGYGRNGMYNHPIAALALSEAYGMAGHDLSGKIRPVVEKARNFTIARQRLPKPLRRDLGGWRYMINDNNDHSDLSVTSWQLLFLRSAKNAGFAVPPDVIEQAMAYVERCFSPQFGTFVYIAQGTKVTRAMAGAGILSMSLGGKHETPAARAAGNWLLTQPFDRYRRTAGGRERWFYTACSTVAKGCSNSAARTGGAFFRRWSRHWWKTKPAMAHGTKSRSTTSMEMHTRPRCAYWRSTRRVKSSRYFNGE